MCFTLGRVSLVINLTLNYKHLLQKVKAIFKILLFSFFGGGLCEVYENTVVVFSSASSFPGTAICLFVISSLVSILHLPKSVDSDISNHFSQSEHPLAWLIHQLKTLSGSQDNCGMLVHCADCKFSTKGCET